MPIRLDLRVLEYADPVFGRVRLPAGMADLLGAGDEAASIAGWVARAGGEVGRRDGAPIGALRNHLQQIVQATAGTRTGEIARNALRPLASFGDDQLLGWSRASNIEGALRESSTTIHDALLGEVALNVARSTTPRLAINYAPEAKQLLREESLEAMRYAVVRQGRGIPTT